MRVLATVMIVPFIVSPTVAIPGLSCSQYIEQKVEPVERATMSQLLRENDLNSDGLISVDDMIEVFHKLGVPQECAPAEAGRAVKFMQRRYDHNGDSEVDHEEVARGKLKEEF